MKKIIYQNTLVFFSYFITYEIQRSTFFLAQSQYFGQNDMLISVASLFFLPHGVRVLSYIFFGPRIFYGLFAAHIATSINFSNIIYLNIFAGFFSSICALIAIKLYIGKYSVQKISDLNVRMVLIVSLFAAIINSISVNISKLIFIDNFSINFTSQIIQYIIGDLMGTIVLFYIFNLTKKILKNSFSNN